MLKKIFVDIMQIVLMLIFLMSLKKSGLMIRGKRKKIISYIDVTEGEDKKILITLKLDFSKEETYELRYMKVKNNIEEIRGYFNIILKDGDCILRRIKPGLMFNPKKIATIYIRRPGSKYDRMPVMLLMEKELRNVVEEMLELDIIELDINDFSTMVERRLLKKLEKISEKKNIWEIIWICSNYWYKTIKKHQLLIAAFFFKSLIDFLSQMSYIFCSQKDLKKWKKEKDENKVLWIRLKSKKNFI